MPSMIVFSTGGPGGKVERLKVTDDPETVVEKFGTSDSGFAEFSPAGKRSTAVWINRDQVRMVRESTDSG